MCIFTLFYAILATRPFLSQIYTLLSVKFSGLKMGGCKKVTNMRYMHKIQIKNVSVFKRINRLIDNWYLWSLLICGFWYFPLLDFVLRNMWSLPAAVQRQLSKPVSNGEGYMRSQKEDIRAVESELC